MVMQNWIICKENLPRVDAGIYVTGASSDVLILIYVHGNPLSGPRLANNLSCVFSALIYVDVR